MKYGELVKVYSKLESSTKRLTKTYHISELLKKTPIEDIKKIVLLLQGKIFAPWNESKIGVAARLVLKAINKATGIATQKIEQKWKELGDLGLAAEEFVAVKKQATLFSQDLEIEKVFNNLRMLPKAEGHGAVDRKVALIAELLTSAKPLEARYIIRTVLEELRVGVGSGSIRDAIVWAYFGEKLGLKFDIKENNFDITDEERIEYNKYVEAVQEAYNLTNDFSEAASIAKTKGLKGLQNVTLETGKPIKIMLYQKAKGFEEAFKTVGKPAALEYKYDGFLMQIHRKGEEIKLFTRRLENVTKQFPDVVEIVKENIKSENYILCGEIIGIDPTTGKWLPFQNISQRIKRKYEIHSMIKEIPVMISLFEAMQINGENILKKPFSERREMMKKIVVEEEGKIQLAKQIITEDEKEAEKFYTESLKKGNEGIMIKALDKPYKPGSRVGYGLKIKPVMETLDLVIVGAEWGEGKRSAWLSSFNIACYQDGKFLGIGKFGTGVKEKEESGGTTFEQLTNLLKPLITSEKGKEVKVKPQIVVEINYEEIQKSMNYNSGYALRFPRFVRLREDRNAEEISTLETVKEYYEGQRGKNG